MSKTLLDLISQVEDDPAKRMLLALQIRKEILESVETSTTNGAMTFTAIQETSK